MSCKYSNGQALHQKILKGVNILADNVASTLGPRGRNVILQQKNKSPMITKDGVTVAKFAILDDPFENVGAEINNGTLGIHKQNEAKACSAAGRA